MAKQPKFYAFLDVVIDVFYSIILYNAFVSFPGLKLESFLMLFAVFVMINYWWDARSDIDMPKHYLGDFYFITFIMFIFAQWPAHFGNVQEFLYVTTLFFFVDAIYARAALAMHLEQADRKSLMFWFKAELLLTIIYGIYSITIAVVTPLSLLLIFLPYLIFFGVNIKKKIFKLKFIDSGNEPY
jgi:hypothetical protein